MNSLRVVLVTRRYWPLVGGAEIAMANLAGQLQRLGHEVTILTARWNPEWPAEIRHREVPVYRLPNPLRRGWGTYRYMLALARWLRSHAGLMDVVCVSMLKHDAYAALGALRGTNVPVVLRAEGGGSSGDCAWQSTARCGPRIAQRCRTADAVIAASDAVRQELLDADYAPSRVHAIPNGVAVDGVATAERRKAARQALAEMHGDLQLPTDAQLVVYTGRLHSGKGLQDLLHAWPEVLERLPRTRLWLIGDGDHRDALYRLVQDFELTGRVLLPGTFDTVDDVLQAADVFVLPSYAEGLSLSLLEAMALGLPVVATDIPGNNELVLDGKTGIRVPPHQPHALAAALIRLLQERVLAAALGCQGRAYVRAHYSLDQMARGHAELFHQVIAARREQRS